MKRNKGLPSKGTYKVKRVMQRFGKRKVQPNQGNLQKKEIHAFNSPEYTTGISSPAGFTIQYTYLPASASTSVTEGGKYKGEG